MANRYANLVGSKKISEDFNNINIGFDRVQTEMDTKGTPADAQTKADAAQAAAIANAAAALTAHKARGADEHPNAKGNSAGFMSAADKLKMDASTNVATPDTLMQRDAAGRAKVAAPAAADDIARKAETDAVQGNLESHAADTDIHVTAEDHDKLDGIAAGAEVNQNAFAKVNDVVASDPSDVVTFVGGTGIVVSTNPMTNEIMLTATSEATPGAHASSHITGGSDVIPDAVTNGASGLMSGADAKFVRQDGESKAGAQAKADAVRDYVDGRLDTPERVAITLQPGVHVVNANQDAAFKLAGLQGRTVLNYQSQIGIYGVLHPYVIRYGVNLLPPLYEWDNQLAGMGNVTDQYKANASVSDSTIKYLRTYIPVLAGQVYSISATTVNSSLYVYACDAGKTRISSRIDSGVITAPTNTAYLEVLWSNTTPTGVLNGAYSITNPMLNIGSIALPFTPRQDSMLAFQTELHANPDTGANPDMVFERDGQYFKLAKWRKTTLDGSITFAPFGSATGLKVVNAMLPGPPAVDGSGTLTKYQGKVIKETDYATVNSAPDNLNIGSSGANGVFDNFQISIAKEDSGWGDNYTNLTADEIKAYFLGYKMAENVTGFPAYNGSGVKCWFGIKSGLAPTTTLPTTPDVGYNPYQLLYQLATPVVEPITSEGQLTFIDGGNQVEVGTGIVLRESVKPALITSDNNYYINSQAALTKLAYKASKFLYVYANSQQVYDWSISTNADSWGAQRLYKDSKNFNSTPAYSVTYLMLDKSPMVDIIGTYAKNEKALLLDTLKSIQENTTRISVLESKKAEKDNATWITPTLLNGWVAYETNIGGYPTARFFKDPAGIVHFDGLIKDGVVSASLPVFKLPVGFRPKQAVTCVTVSNNGSGEVISRVRVNPNGEVVFNNGGNVFFSLVIPPFLAEQ